MKIILNTLAATLLLSLVVLLPAQAQKTSFHSFKTETIDGKPFDLASLKGKKVLVVNTASKCGFTPQYADLQALWQKYGGEHFVIIGFPANNFLSQEPGSNAEIKQFCTSQYEVTFPMMHKISVKGKDIDPIYKWLTTKDLNGKMDAGVSWNFQKFMIDENGNLVDMVPPSSKPNCDKIVNWITGK
jgi:glutathione peroxidase